MRHRASEIRRRVDQAERIDKHGSQLCTVTGFETGDRFTVDVQPIYRRNFMGAFGAVTPERGPIIPGVGFSSFGGLIKPQSGMVGLLIQTENEIREWILSGSGDITTRETRRNDRSSGVFFPITSGDGIGHICNDAGITIDGNGCDLLEILAAGFASLNRPDVAAEIRKVKG